MVYKLIVDNETGGVVGVKGRVLEPDYSVKSARDVVDSYEIPGLAVLGSSGGTGGNTDYVRFAYRSAWHITRELRTRCSGSRR
jgi:predicted oxidoreductase